MSRRNLASYISPSTRRTASVTEPKLDGMNDDEAEKKERRKSRLLHLQRCHLMSPSSPVDSRETSTPPLSGLTNSQLTEHYANCIKLSTENKINAKNAFGLHLIDYMAELLKKKEMTNFQVASSTLDASAKIYAGRVDAIHAETFKVLTGLGRSTDKNNKVDQDENDEEPGDEDDPHRPPGAKKRKTAKQGKTIETNLKNINVPKLDLAFKMDPLFHKTSAAFDEGGTAGLLLNQLHCRDDMSELVLDSNTVLTELDDHHMPSDRPTITSEQSAAIRDLKRMFLNLKLSNAFICPEFSEFEFGNYKVGHEDGFNSFLARKKKDSYAFDLDADVDTIPESTDNERVEQYIDDGFGPIEDSDNDQPNNSGEAHNSSGQSIIYGDSREAQMIKNTISNIKHGTVGTLIQVLATEPSDYSYFNTKLLQTWAGPSHWKLPPQSEKEVSTNKVNRKKDPFVLDFDEEINIEEHLKEKRAATMLTDITVKRWNKNQTTFPADLHYEEECLFKLFSKPKLMVKRQKRHSSVDLDNDDDFYDYDNSNDRDNFCPQLPNNDGDNDDDDRGEFCFDTTTRVTQTLEQTQQQDRDEVFGGDGEGFGAELVEQPRKIARIDIGYAKTAKKVDVKLLKSSMWSLLDDNKSLNDDDVMSDQSADCENGVNTKRRRSFKALIKELPQKISKTMSSHLSVPIVFVCLLHLANEKTLDLKSNEDMDDLTISHG